MADLSHRDVTVFWDAFVYVIHRSDVYKSGSPFSLVNIPWSDAFIDLIVNVIGYL